MAAVWDGVGLRDEAEVTYVSNMSLVYQATQARLRQVRAAEPEQARGRSYWELHHCVCERRVRRRERVRGAPWWSLECMCVLTAFRQLCLCCDRRPALLPAVASGGSFPAPPPPPSHAPCSDVTAGALGDLLESSTNEGRVPRTAQCCSCDAFMLAMGTRCHAENSTWDGRRANETFEGRFDGVRLEEAVAAYQAGSSDWLLPGYLGELANIARFLLFRRRWVARKVGSRRPAPCARGGPPVLSSARRPQP